MTTLLPRPRFLSRRRPEVVAGVDLGSNSFHMLVARAEEDGRVHVLDKLRDPVRLAGGLDEERSLTPEAMQRGLAALERFGERVRGTPSTAVRAVGTNTLRMARNGHEFAERGSEALGHPIEIISGHEEARLIYLGVAHATPGEGGRRLVLDIGGGSTECVIGEGYDALVLDSLYMGCVSWTRRFFDSAGLTSKAFERAEIAAELEFSSLRAQYRGIGWQRATGSSGTILAVSEVLRQQGWSDGEIRFEALERLEKALLGFGSVADISLPGLEPDRAAVFPGGLSILKAAFQHLGIESMGTSSGALREGLVHELLGRRSLEDPRDRTIDTFATRYKVDRSHARRVEETALELFQQANDVWCHEPEGGRRMLAWAARVHEVGLSIAHSGYHKHGAYILEHAEMPGFSIDEQETLATVVGAHRRKVSKRSFQHLTGERRSLVLHLTLLLRLATRLHHSRSDEPLPPIGIELKKSRLRLRFPEGWLEARPLTQADLEGEAAYLARLGVKLDWRGHGQAA